MAGLGSYNPQALYGTPLSQTYGQAQKAYAGNVAIQDKQREQQQLAAMQEAWAQSGGDIEAFLKSPAAATLSIDQQLKLRGHMDAQAKAAQEAAAAEQQRNIAVGLAQSQTPLAPSVPPQYEDVTGPPTAEELTSQDRQFVQSAIQRRQQMAAAAAQPEAYTKQFIKGIGGDAGAEDKRTEFFKKIDRINELRALDQRTEAQEFELNAITDSLQTAKIRNQQYSKDQLRAMLPNLQQMDSHEAFRQGFRMKDDGSLWTDVEGLPVELPSFDEKMGKRTNVKELLEIGEMRDDLVQAEDLLKNPELFNEARELWDNEVRSMTTNTFRKWMQNRGINPFSPLGELMIRVQRISSDERKRMMGTAVTKIELESALAWLPEASDGWPEMTQKIKVAASEADERLYRWLNSFKHIANMAPFYDAFGLDRFDRPETGFTYTRGGQPDIPGAPAPDEQPRQEQPTRPGHTRY
jgi:hypothetical protein